MAKGMAVFAHAGEEYTVNDPNIANEFSSSASYAAGDYCYYQGNLYRFSSAHSGAWTGSDASVIKVKDAIRNAVAQIAPDFSTSAAYTKGQYVTYCGTLYRFKADHAAGAWNSSHVVQVSVGDETATAKSAIPNVMDEFSENGTIHFALTNGYIDYSTGNWNDYSEDGKYKATKQYIAIVPNERYVFENGTGYYSSGYAFYDKDFAYISGKNDYTGIVVSPANAYYIRFSDYNANASHSIEFKKYTDITESQIALEKYRKITPSLINGYIDNTDGSYHNYGSGEYKCTDFIRVIEDTEIRMHINGVSGDAGLAYYDSSFGYISGGTNDTSNKPQNAAYIRFTDYDSTKNHNNVYLEVYLPDYVDELLAINGHTAIFPVMKDGYIDYTDGEYHSYSGSGKYKYCDYARIYSGVRIRLNCTFEGDAGYALYNKSKEYITGSNKNEDIIVPENAYYIRFSDYSASGTHRAIKYILYSEMHDDSAMIRIQCIGDSVTQGMGMTGAGYSRYMENTYPAKLQTLIQDNSFDNVSVQNCGHGGERTPDIAVRCGGFAGYISEDITVPGDGTYVGLGQAVPVSGRITGTKIKAAYSDGDGNDYCVYFTQTSHDTNPVYIEGIPYTMRIGEDVNEICQANPDGNSVTIKAGSLLFTNDDRNPTINIIYGGINDGASMTLERWIDTMEACANVNGGHYIVIGSTHALWNNWSDVTGTDAEKYVKYKKAAAKAFGVHFIDMYKEFFEHALAYSLEAGYFSDKTSAQLESMQELLDQHIVPADFSYDKAHQGDVHLSEEGYYVFAALLFERLQRLGYLKK